MITDTDTDGKKSYRSALIGSVGQLVSVLGLTYTGCINMFILPIALVYCIPPMADALKQFRNV
jgi:hypothetical protein